MNVDIFPLRNQFANWSELDTIDPVHSECKSVKIGMSIAIFCGKLYSNIEFRLASIEYPRWVVGKRICPFLCLYPRLLASICSGLNCKKTNESFQRRRSLRSNQLLRLVLNFSGNNLIMSLSGNNLIMLYFSFEGIEKVLPVFEIESRREWFGAMMKRPMH